MADQENYDNNEELMNEQEFMGDNNGDSNNQDDDHNGTNGGAENAGRDDDRWATLARISAPRFDWQEKTINAHPRVFPTSFWFWKLFSLVRHDGYRPRDFQSENLHSNSTPFRVKLT